MGDFKSQKSNIKSQIEEARLVCKGLRNCSLVPGHAERSARQRIWESLCNSLSKVPLLLPTGFPGYSELLLDTPKKPEGVKAFVWCGESYLLLPEAVVFFKNELRTAQATVQEIIERLVELQGVPRYLTDYEGDLCDRPSGQGFPICSFANPDLVFPHCRIHLERMLQDEREAD